MAEGYKVAKQVLRYVVPFKYKDDFETCFKNIEKQTLGTISYVGSESKNVDKKLWHRRTSVETEWDLFEYVTNEFLSNDDCNPSNDNKIGYNWYVDNNEDLGVNNIFYFKDGLEKSFYITDDVINFKITEINLILCKNGIGFLSYDIDLKQKVNTIQLLEFQNVVKEFVRDKNDKFWRELNLVIDSKSKRITGFKNQKYKNLVYSHKVDNSKKLLEPLFLGEWVNDVISSLNVEFFTPKRTDYISSLLKCRDDILEVVPKIISADIKEKKIIIENKEKKKIQIENEEERKILVEQITNEIESISKKLEDPKQNKKILKSKKKELELKREQIEKEEERKILLEQIYREIESTNQTLQKLEQKKFKLENLINEKKSKSKEKKEWLTKRGEIENNPNSIEKKDREIENILQKIRELSDQKKNLENNNNNIQAGCEEIKYINTNINSFEKQRIRLEEQKKKTEEFYKSIEEKFENLVKLEEDTKKQILQKKSMIEKLDLVIEALNEELEQKYEECLCYANNLQKSDENDKKDISNYTSKIVVPDKALIFDYCILEGKELCIPNLINRKNYMGEIAWRLARGYKDTYHFNQEHISAMYCPFAEDIVFAAQEGIAYVAWPTEDNAEQYATDVLPSIKDEYFHLYLKVLYQSYSLLNFAENLQKEISMNEDKDKLLEKLEELIFDINLFLAKNMATSVSFIHHHNDFYNYLKERLRIHADVKSLNAGLESLESMARKNAEQAEADREKQLTAGVGLLAVLSVLSALTDGSEFIKNVSEYVNPEFSGYAKNLYAFIGAISCFFLFYTGSAIWEAHKKNPKEIIKLMAISGLIAFAIRAILQMFY